MPSWCQPFVSVWWWIGVGGIWCSNLYVRTSNIHSLGSNGLECPFVSLSQVIFVCLISSCTHNPQVVTYIWDLGYHGKPCTLYNFHSEFELNFEFSWVTRDVRQWRKWKWGCGFKGRACEGLDSFIEALWRLDVRGWRLGRNRRWN